MHRISKNFHHYFGRDIGCPDRILPIPGDFSQPNLGTPLEQYEQLCREVDYVYHLGAHINFFSTYDQLKSGNVDSNIGLIRFATTAKLKKIIYTSTTSIFSDLSRPRYENDPIENERHLFLSGYTSSKWVGEKMMLTAMENGVPIQLFRLGLTTGDNQRGVLPQNQWLTKLLETCAIVGYFPMHQSLSVAPVDFVARSLAHLSLDRHYCPGLYHLTSPEQTDLSYFFDEQSGEKRAKGIPLQEWVEKIIAISKDQPLPILPFIEMINKDVHGQLADKPKKYPISSDFTLSKLKELGIEYSFDVRSIQSYLNKYVNI
jgi:thioester reductase-like protein